MRITSRFQRLARSRDRRRHALTAGIWGGLISLGCFFGLEPLAEPDGGIDGGGIAGAFGGRAGETPVGGAGGAAGTIVFPGCDELGQKRCDDICVAIQPENGCGNPNCQPCPAVANASLSCSADSGSCKVDGCDPGYADCDGDTLAYPERSDGNGCEYSFGTIASSTDPLVVPQAQIRVDDNSRDDWSGIPAYRLEQTCVDCEDDVAVFQPIGQNEAPPGSDLSAYFRVAWDADFFYVLAEAFDDHVFNQGSTVDNGGCRTNGDYVPGPICEDAFAVYFDALQDGGNIASNGNHRILLGTSGTPFAPAQGQPPGATVGMRVLPSNGLRCYRMEAQFDWKFLVSNQAEPIPGKFPPATGQTYGFDIAVSDWDPSVSEASTFERQSQLFWTPRAPQSKLHPLIEGVGNIILADSSELQ